jgi:hypothetical protein
LNGKSWPLNHEWSWRECWNYSHNPISPGKFKKKIHLIMKRKDQKYTCNYKTNAQIIF